MKKRFLVFLLLLSFLVCFAAGAEAAGTKADSTKFSCTLFDMMLPAGLVLMDEASLTGYEAAAQSDYPDSAETLLVAVSDDAASAVIAASQVSKLTPMKAAEQAAAEIFGKKKVAQRAAFGENECACFACVIEGSTYNVYYFSNGETLLSVTASGLTDAQIRAMLESIHWNV